MLFWLMILLAYLMGSIPSAVWVTQYYSGGDIRKLGDRNPGAANVFREIGQKAAVLVLIMDISKGLVVVSIPQFFDFSNLYFHSFPLFQLLLTLAVVIGHRYPLFARFSGGKGVAALIGALIGIQPQMLLFYGLGLLLVLTVFELVDR